ESPKVGLPQVHGLAILAEAVKYFCTTWWFNMSFKLGNPSLLANTNHYLCSSDSFIYCYCNGAMNEMIRVTLIRGLDRNLKSL
ncbi:hypothetical protein THRCLA_20090, partial [Thraustotheca clavata]